MRNKQRLRLGKGEKTISVWDVDVGRDQENERFPQVLTRSDGFPSPSKLVSGPQCHTAKDKVGELWDIFSDLLSPLLEPDRVYSTLCVGSLYGAAWYV